MLHNIIKKIAISWRDYSLNWRDDLESARTRRRNDDPTMNPRVYKWFHLYYHPTSHPSVEKKETASTNVSPVAAGLNCKWTQLSCILEMLDDQSLLFWWTKDCSRRDRKLFRSEVMAALKLIDGYLRDEKILSDLDDMAVGRRIHVEIGQKIYDRVVSPLQNSSNLDPYCADFRILARELERIKTEIRVLVEGALVRQKIEAGWHLLLRGNL